MGDRRADRASEPNLELPSIFGRGKRRRGVEDKSYDEVETHEPPENEPTSRIEVTLEAPPSSPTPRGGRRAEKPSRRATKTAARAADTSTDTSTDTVVEEPVVAADAPVPKPERPKRTAPALPRGLALPVVGLVVGLVGVGLTGGSLRGCEAVRGTSSCGGGPGLLLLVVIFLAMVALGSALLGSLRVAEARATSFLAVGILTVVVMVALMNVVLSTWMLVAVPVLGLVAYALAGWVTTQLYDATERGPEHDVR